MPGGLHVWAVHFVGGYAIASVGNAVSDAEAPTGRANDGTDTFDLANNLARLGACSP